MSNQLRMRVGTAGRRMVVAALLCVLAVPAGAGADETDRLVVEGARSSYVDFHVVERSIHLDPRRVAIVGGRGYAALYISSLGDRRPPDAFGVVRASLLSPGHQVFGFPELRPGRYRARLLTDAPARVVLPVFSRNGLRLRPRAPLPVAVRGGQAEVAAGVSDRELRLDDAVPAGTHALFARRVTGQRLEQTHACVTADARCRNLPFTLPPAPEPDSPVTVPSNSNAVVAGVVAPSPQGRDAVLGVEGVRTTDGLLQSFVLAFRDPPAAQEPADR